MPVATAKAGWPAGGDRMTGVYSRSSQVGRWRRSIRACGSDEPVTDDADHLSRRPASDDANDARRAAR
jgi:hypothetical protein